MTIKYALLNPKTNKVRAVSPSKLASTALPVKYPKITADRVEMDVRQNPIDEWRVFASHVEPTYTIKPFDLDAEKEVRREYARHLRWKKEISGTHTAEGLFVSTDERSQNRVTNLLTLFLAIDEDRYVDFEAQPNVWVDVDYKRAKDIARSVTEHVQECYFECRKLHEEIDAATNMRELTAINFQAM